MMPICWYTSYTANHMRSARAFEQNGTTMDDSLALEYWRRCISPVSAVSSCFRMVGLLAQWRDPHDLDLNMKIALDKSSTLACSAFSSVR